MHEVFNLIGWFLTQTSIAMIIKGRTEEGRRGRFQQYKTISLHYDKYYYIYYTYITSTSGEDSPIYTYMGLYDSE